MNTVLSIVVLVAIALVGGAYVYWRQTGDMKKPVLMLILAAVAIANVLIWTVPTDGGQSPLDVVEKETDASSVEP